MGEAIASVRSSDGSNYCLTIERAPRVKWWVVVLLGLAVLVVGVSCNDTPQKQSASTTQPTLAAPGAAEQVCQLLSDQEVSATLSIEGIVHRPAASDDPRSCTWGTGDEPAQAVVLLALAPPQFLQSPPNSDEIGPPCEQGSTLSATTLGRAPASYVTCFLDDGVAILLTAKTTERSHVRDLLAVAVPRIGSIDRAALGLRPRTEARGMPTTTTAQVLSAPPECVEAWRSGATAPIHCEDYPEAYQAFLKESGRG